MVTSLGPEEDGGETAVGKKNVTAVNTFMSFLSRPLTAVSSGSYRSYYDYEETRAAPLKPIPKDVPLTVPDSLGDPATRKIRE